MKIYILEVDKRLQPDSQPMRYPSFNDDYGVEQDFLKYLSIHKELVVDNPREATWHYLPIYWTRWHLNHNYAQDGISELQGLADNAIVDPRITFTICQYDDGPMIDLPGVTVLLSSRKGNSGIDIPLLSKPLKIPWIKPKKTLTASFIGRLSTHPVRTEMKLALASYSNVEVIDGHSDVTTYINKLLISKIALCPRGYGGSSFRFYEAMQLGIVPLLLGENDTRPFKHYIDWSKCSLYCKNTSTIMSIITKYSDERITEMGKMARQIWKSEIKYQKWCKNAILELKNI